MVRVSQDGGDGVGIFNHGDQTHAAMAAGADQGIVEGAPHQLTPRNAHVLGWGICCRIIAVG